LIGDDDDFCSACRRGLTGAILTAFATFWLGLFVEAGQSLLGYFATASVLELAGILIAARLNSCWRHKTLNACQVVDELPSKMIDDKEDHNVGLEMGMREDDTETLDNNVGLEMGMRAVQEDDTETLALAEKCASLSSDETDLEIPT
jgi:hypothetical protein